MTISAFLVIFVAVSCSARQAASQTLAGQPSFGWTVFKPEIPMPELSTLRCYSSSPAGVVEVSNGIPR
jgi:hypothetical protein